METIETAQRNPWCVGKLPCAMLEEQRDELEALKSIYDGDSRFVVVSDTSFQYKVGDEDSCGCFIVQIDWPDTYPLEAPPRLSLELFFNRHLIPSVKENILTRLAEEAALYAGMAVTFCLLEYLKEHWQTLTADQPRQGASPSEEDGRVNEPKTVQMSKAQKRRMWNRGEGGEEKPRGHDWIDIIKHLSQTGGGACAVEP